MAAVNLVIRASEPPPPPLPEPDRVHQVLFRWKTLPVFYLTFWNDRMLLIVSYSENS